MSHYKPYPAYRESGVEWIGQVPEDWSLLRLANAGSLMKANGGNKQDDTDTGVPCIRYGDLYTTYDLLIRYIGKFISPEAEVDYTTIQYGDILFAASGETFEEIGKSAVNLTETHACCGGDVIVLRPQRKIDPVFLAYASGSSSAQAQKSLMGKGFTVIHIYGDQIRNLIIAAPSEQEQKLIGAKIERETSRINALITKKTRFIELLKEKRQALITHAVTKGLDPNVKMKDSGVEWLGEVPSDWIVGRLRDFCTAISTGPFGTALGANDYIENGIPVINPSHMENGCCSPDPTVSVSVATAKRLQFWALRNGDVVAARRGELGRAAVVRCHEVGWICGTGSLRLAPNPKRIIADYIYSVLQSSYARAWLAQESVGSTMPNLNEALIGKLPLAIPSTIVAQASLLSTLEKNLSRLAALIAKTQHSIDLLKERRSALITAAVTGQIDLRESV